MSSDIIWNHSLNHWIQYMHMGNKLLHCILMFLRNSIYYSRISVFCNILAKSLNIFHVGSRTFGKVISLEQLRFCISYLESTSMLIYLFGYCLWIEKTFMKPCQLFSLIENSSAFKIIYNWSLCSIVKINYEGILASTPNLELETSRIVLLLLDGCSIAKRYQFFFTHICLILISVAFHCSCPDCHSTTISKDTGFELKTKSLEIDDSCSHCMSYESQRYRKSDATL